MSDYIEIISPRTMTCKILKDMVVVEEYRIEQCDKCSQLKRLDPFGYQKAMTTWRTLFGSARIADD